MTVIEYSHLYMNSTFVDIKFLLKYRNTCSSTLTFSFVTVSWTISCDNSLHKIYLSYKQSEDYLKYMDAELEHLTEKSRVLVGFGIHRYPRTSSPWILRLTVSCDLAISHKSISITKSADDCYLLHCVMYALNTLWYKAIIY